MKPMQSKTLSIKLKMDMYLIEWSKEIFQKWMSLLSRRHKKRRLGRDVIDKWITELYNGKGEMCKWLHYIINRPLQELSWK